MPFNFAPNINIPIDSFKRQEDPFGQIMPGFLQGQTAADALLKRRALQGVFSGIQNQPGMGSDPLAQLIGNVGQADPTSGMQLLPTYMAGLLKKQNRKPGGETRTIYQSPKTGDVSGEPQTGWTPVTLPESQATLRLQSQGEANRRAGRFNQIMGLNTGKAANMIDINQGSLVDDASQLEGLLNKMQLSHMALYQKSGGALKGRATKMMSNLTGGTSSYATPFGQMPVPGANPDVKAFNDLTDGTIQQLSFFLKEKGKLSDADAEKRLGPLKASLTKDPAAVARTMDGLREILSAAKTNDINRMNRAYSRLGISSRIKPNMENARLMMQQQMMASMAGGGGMNPQMMQPQDLGGLSDEQLQQMLQEAE